MSETTNLKLKKHDDVLESTNAFDIEEYLNDNWDKIDENIEQINEKIKQNSNNIESLQTDNTTNKKSIEELKQKDAEQDESVKTNASEIENLKQENIEIKAENERLKNDIKSIALIGEESGESIDLEDSSEARFNKFEIGGNHRQETREGIQLLNIEDRDETTIDGVTYSIKNGKIILNGKSTAKIDILLYAEITGLDKNSSYSFNAITEQSSDFAFNTYRGSRWENLIQQVGNTNKNGWSSSGYDSYYFDINIFEERTFKNTVITPMFVKGTTIPTYYEQYGAMPSLEFPSEIKTVKDNINEVICNENLLYINKKTNKVVRGGVTIELLENGNIKFNGASTSAMYISLLNLTNVAPSTFLQRYFNIDKYSLYYNYVSGKILEKNVSFNIREKTNSQSELSITIDSNNFQKNQKIEKEISNKKNVEYIWVNSGTSFDNLEFNLQLKKENNLANFVEHQSQSIAMPVQQEMLDGDYFDFENEKEVHKWGKIILNGSDLENWTLLSGENSIFVINNVIKRQGSNDNLAVCTRFKFDKRISGMSMMKNNTFAIQFQYSNIYIKCDKFTDIDSFKAKLKELYDAGNPIIIYYKIATPTELEFTDEQKAIAKQIKQTLHTYKNITHIYSEDEISPKIDIEYAKDLNTVINNIQAQIINNASKEV